MFAEVSISVCYGADRHSVTISEHVFDWESEVYSSKAIIPKVREDDEFIRGARKGVEYALANAASFIYKDHVAITIETIRVLLCDSTENTVAYAACFATWQALETEGRSTPKIVGRRVVFPDSHPS